MMGGLMILITWVVVWKGLALWYTAQNNQKGWFVAILILNTLGFLPIIYLIWFKPISKKNEEEREEMGIKKIEKIKKETSKKKPSKNKKGSNNKE
jgi:carboxypeptidase C (cathepsin A)